MQNRIMLIIREHTRYEGSPPVREGFSVHSLEHLQGSRTVFIDNSNF